MKELSVIVVSYNTRDLLLDCLRSVEKETEGLDAEVFVVDNGSADGSADAVEAEFPAVTLLRNEENRGFGRANNQALRRARGEFVLLLNPDATLEPGSVSALLDHIRGRPEAAVVAPRLLYPDGRRQPSVFRFPVAWRDLLLLRLPWIRRCGPFSESPERTRDVDWLLGAVLLCRSEAIHRVEGFDPRFFLFGEETDLQLRLARAGYARVFVASATVIHHKAQAVRQEPVANMLRRYTAMDLFATLHQTRRVRILYRTAWIAGLVARTLRCGLVALVSPRADVDTPTRGQLRALRYLARRWAA